jgi:hypothetical protein
MHVSGFDGWLTAFAATLAIEVPIYAWALRRCASSRWRICATAVAANAATHPALSAWIKHSTPSLAAVVVAELAVALVESCVLWALLRRYASWPSAQLAALAANSASFAVGAALARL